MSGKKPSQELWNELPKPFAPALHDGVFREKIGQTTVGDKLVEDSAPFIRDAKEVDALVQRRQIEPENYTDYIFSSPEFMGAARAAFRTGESAVRLTPVPQNILQATRIATQLNDKILAAIQSSGPRGSGSVRHLSQVVGFFSMAFIESLYLRTAMSQLRAVPSAKEAGIINQMRSAEVYFRKSSSLSPRLGAIASYLEYAKGDYFRTLRMMSGHAGALLQSADDSAESLHHMQQEVLSGNASDRAYSQTVTPDGVIQITVEPLSEDEASYEFQNELPRMLASVRVNIVPAGHEGYFAAEPVAPGAPVLSGTHLYISGEKGRLEICGSCSTSIGTVLSNAASALISTHVLSLAHESFTRDYHVGKPVPMDAEPAAVEQLPVVDVLQPKEGEIESQQNEVTFRLPRDMRGDDLVAAIGRMNRSFLRDAGVSGEELDRRSDPFIRQKGSHATIYCVETDRIAPVPLHSKALPIGTLRSILKMLKIDPVRLVNAL